MAKSAVAKIEKPSPEITAPGGGQQTHLPVNQWAMEAQWLQTIKELATNKDVGVEGIKELMKERREERAHMARVAFRKALAAARGEIKPIEKKQLVSYQNKGGDETSYHHESMSDIAEAVDQILSKHGLSYTYESDNPINEPIKITCVLGHELGHETRTTLRAGADNSGGKNTIQAIGSATHYLERYTLRLALGLSTTKKSDDGAKADELLVRTITTDQEEDLAKEIKGTKLRIETFLKTFKIPSLADLPESRFEEAMARLAKRRKELEKTNA